MKNSIIAFLVVVSSWNVFAAGEYIMKREYRSGRDGMEYECYVYKSAGKYFMDFGINGERLNLARPVFLTNNDMELVKGAVSATGQKNFLQSIPENSNKGNYLTFAKYGSLKYGAYSNRAALVLQAELSKMKPKGNNTNYTAAVVTRNFDKALQLASRIDDLCAAQPLAN